MSVMIKEKILQKKDVIVRNWIQTIFDTYPAETSDFLGKQKNQFSNPVGHIISETAESLFEAIINGSQALEIKILLNDLIKVRAVQNFLPSQAAGFIFPLRNIIREQVNTDLNDEKSFEEFWIIESEIDSAALIAFDLFLEAREKIFQLRINDIKNRVVA
jgi:RsbT co-antagonist protein rsbRD N-terminal domain